MSLYAQWLKAKEAEAEAMKTRRKIEDTLVATLGAKMPTSGTLSFDHDDFRVKITARLNRKIDPNLLQDIARDQGLSDHLGSLFRWTPEVNARAWAQAAQNITAPLLGAITTTPGRPSFSVQSIDEA